MPKKGMEGAKGRVRDSKSHQRYISEGRERRNQLRRIERHLRHFPNDNQAKGALVRTQQRSPYAPPTKRLGGSKPGGGK